jgi:hypothetical protein
MATYSLSNKQLIQLKSKIEEFKKLATTNIDFKIDDLGLYVHPKINDTIVIQLKTHGINAGKPFHDVNYYFVNKFGEIEENHQVISGSTFNINAYYTFIADLRKIEIVDGKIKFI